MAGKENLDERQIKFKLIFRGKKVGEFKNPGNHFVKSFKFKEDGEGWHTIYFRYISVDMKEMKLFIEPMMAEKIEVTGYTVDKYGTKPNYKTIRLEMSDLEKISKNLKFK